MTSPRPIPFWITLSLSCLTLLVLVFMGWELVLNNYFQNTDWKQLHGLFIARGMTTAALLAVWASWFVWRHRLQVEAERASFHETMLHAEKLASLGRMAGNLAHQLNSPLGSALLRLQHMQRTDPNEHLLAVERAIRSCQRSISALLEYVKAPAEEERGHCSAEEAVRVTAGFLEPLLQRQGVSLEVEEAEASQANVAIGLSRLENLLVNLVENAAQAQPGGGKVWLRVRPGSEGLVELQVLDAGPGFSQDALVHAGEPFFTTRPLGQGTGMGLALVSKFVEAAGGKLELSNRPEGGACVKVLLPVYQTPPGPEGPCP